jgi:glucose-1-phosphate cytidylyltransferase
VILCGGKGMRLREYTEAIPKVLVEVGGKPIIWHIMKGYARFGHTEFVLALGYLGDRIKEYFLDYHSWRRRDMRLHLGNGNVPELLGDNREDWSITFANTGLETNTGGRIKRLEPYLADDLFFATYGDGVSDIDLRTLLEFHRSHGRVATVSVVQPRLTLGVLDVDGQQRVTRFEEKPLMNGWVNGGFFVFDRRIFGFLDDQTDLERECLVRLADAGQLMAYQHHGFWACMDTYKDNVDLNAAWACGRAPWRTWEETRVG